MWCEVALSYIELSFEHVENNTWPTLEVNEIK